MRFFVTTVVILALALVATVSNTPALLAQGGTVPGGTVPSAPPAPAPPDDGVAPLPPDTLPVTGASANQRQTDSGLTWSLLFVMAAATLVVGASLRRRNTGA